ncbi:MurR/RpiR family transcriptional regulator [Chthonobacter albigriseus]|uniref:MurR/RpiR family transcriptional regulator n=1 Tax=Chthonobacter albigriseus TaxID=1683161 RepID=UPI001FCE7790|nr:MurR/RpiR family transcriptional regulator [Chthonobacter albigriseus]
MVDDLGDGYPAMSEGLPPRDFQSLRDLMVSRRIKLPKRLAQVASFAIGHPDEIAFGTVASIAEKADVQPSTLVRFSQAIGFQGFSDLQAIFRERLRDRVSTYDDRIRRLRSDTSPDSRTAQLFDGFCQAASASIAAMHDRIEIRTIEAAAQRLAAAETVYLIAQRRSYPVTAYMSYAFGKLGVKTVLVGSAAGTDAETLSFATDKDAAVAISFTPYASATLAHARQVAQRGTPLVVITDSPFSPLVADTDVWFEVVEADFQGFRSLSATLALAMTLTVAVAEIRADQ